MKVCSARSKDLALCVVQHAASAVQQVVMLQSMACAVRNIVGVEASFNTTLSLQRKGALKCTYFDNIIKLHIIVLNEPPSLKIFLGRPWS